MPWCTLAYSCEAFTRLSTFKGTDSTMCSALVFLLLHNTTMLHDVLMVFVMQHTKRTCCVPNVYALYNAMLSVEYLMSVPSNLYILCSVVCYIYPCLYNCCVLHACTLFMYISLFLSEGTMVDEHCTAQWLHKFVYLCLCLYCIYISLCCTLVK